MYNAVELNCRMFFNIYIEHLSDSGGCGGIKNKFKGLKYHVCHGIVNKSFTSIV